MKIGVPIRELSVEVKNRALIITYPRLFKVVSSAALNGGLTQARSIINCQVSKNYDHENPEQHLERMAKKLKVTSPVIGLLTAVDVRNFSISVSHALKRSLITIATAGITNATRLGEQVSTDSTGTINLIVLYEGDMTDGCMVNAVQTIAESKCAVLRELDIRTKKTGELATGTSTDTIVLCCLGEGEKLQYAGSATEIGNELGGTVQDSIRDSLRKQEKLVSGRSIATRLEERGIRINDILEASLELFTPHPGIKNRRDARRILIKELLKALDDINICCLILAGMRLEEEGNLGLCPQMDAEKFRGDPVYLLADEMIGRQIADYIGGARASFEFERFDREKPGILRKLGPVMDDIIAGIAAGISSKMYSTRLEEISH
ncbi:MAG: adenosylcobinamide amidohydrolase [Candidatus Bathyarchaeota archaeon]|nr:MAG: adenosylcobinamide amidohydrolase [Candidatus Bathyarchaeota archaeon]